jgi:hypothetical protein
MEKEQYAGGENSGDLIDINIGCNLIEGPEAYTVPEMSYVLMSRPDRVPGIFSGVWVVAAYPAFSAVAHEEFWVQVFNIDANRR